MKHSYSSPTRNAAAKNTGRTSPRRAICPPDGSEDYLADQFSVRQADTLRYVALWRRWLQWDGTRWKFEDTLVAFDQARLVAREFANRSDAPTKLAKAAVVAAIERLPRADRRHAKTVDIWDADPWLSNTPGGVIDLHGGETLPHEPHLYMTKITAARPGGDCPIWLAFLDRITKGDKDLQSYLQRVAGYCLTGTTREHDMFFLYGTGANGKGVFLNTLTAIWCDYSAVAPMETFIETTSDRHPTDLAMLRGARLVVAQETEKGRHWAESKIKALTGGDPITARFMRQDFFTYSPAFKLVIAGNHKPSLKSVDEAIRRRIQMIPFTVTIPENERDQQLFEKLKPEWPGILQWAVDGCLEWQKQGLTPRPQCSTPRQNILPRKTPSPAGSKIAASPAVSIGASAIGCGEAGKRGPKPATNAPVPERDSPIRWRHMVTPQTAARKCAGMPAST